MPGDLTEHFSRADFACKDGCGFDAVSMDLVERLERMRAFLGERIIIESGCHCPKHNAEVGGATNSAHLTGEAADPRPDGGRWDGNVRFRWVEAALAAGFRRIGIGPTKIHVDVSRTLPWPVLWLYKK